MSLLADPWAVRLSDEDVMQGIERKRVIVRTVGSSRWWFSFREEVEP